MTSLVELNRKFDRMMKEPDNPSLCNEIGVALYYAKDKENALLYLQRAYELRPMDGDILYNYALLLYSQLEWEKASALLQAFMEIHGDNTEMLKKAADCYFHLGEYELAANYLNQSIKMESQQS